MNRGSARVGWRGGAGRLVGTLFFGIFLLVGLGFTATMAIAGGRYLSTWTWDETPCRIEASSVERVDDPDDPYRVVVRYRYEADGRELVGDRVSFGESGHDSWDAAQRVVDRHPLGSAARCFVDPKRPDSAVLERATPWFLLAVPLPLVFVAFGAFGLVAAWRGARGGSERPRPLSADAVNAGIAGRKVAASLGAVLLVGGGIGSWFLLVRPLVQLVDAQGWSEVPCTVISSEVRAHRSDDGTTYSVDILYQYRWGERTHRSSRHRFIGGSSSGRAAKQDVVERYPAGSRRTCWVDPDNPGVAVLDRGFHPIYLLGLIPLAAALGGALALAYGLRRPRPGSAPAAASAVPGRTTASAVRVERTGAPGKKALGLAFATVFWNGIVAVFLFEVVDGWRRGSPDVFLTVFLTPFLLVGLGLIVGTVGAVLAMANPRVTLRLTPPTPRLGQDLTVEWTVSGRVERIARLTVGLEGRERATFSRGTDTVTEHQVFARLAVLDALGPGVARGSVQARLPEDTMHTFSSAHNGIEWRLLVRGEIPSWPDVADDHVLEVLPLDPGNLIDPRGRR